MATSSDPLPKLLLNELASKLDEMVEFLVSLVRMESPSDRTGCQAEILEFLRRSLTEVGFEVTYTRGENTGGYLVARPEEAVNGGPTQLLVGHCDTVWPLGTLEEMPVRIDDGKIRGPGVFDMKAGLTQMVYALRTLKELDLRTEVAPIVVINSDEEQGSPESTAAIEKLAREADRAFVFEPALGLDGRLKTARKGVGRFTVTVHGKAAHAGLDPGMGANAIVELSRIIQKIFGMNDAAGGVTLNVGQVEGGVRPNVVAPSARAVVDVRVPTHAHAKRVTKQLFAISPSQPKLEITVDGAIGRPPMEFTEGNRVLWERARLLAGSLGANVQRAMAGGGSDGNTTSQFVPTLDGLGAVGDGAHALHEFAIAQKMVERTALTCLLLQEGALFDE